MKIKVVGLNHKTAPINIREKLAIQNQQIHAALGKLKEDFPQAEFVLLSTCNRTELYNAARGNLGMTTDDLAEFLSVFCSIPVEEFKKYLYIYHDEQAVDHLLTVSASLDSLVIGEAQIISQVKESYRQAVQAESTGKVLNRLFHCAFATSKEVYTQTSIAQRRVSIAGVAIDLAGQLFENITAARIAVIGAGEMGELVIRHLRDIGSDNITVFNRSFSRAKSMADKYGIRAQPWEYLKNQLEQVDMVVAAAATENYLFDKTFLPACRRGSLLIIDIAVPRNFDPDVNELEDVYLYSIDDLAEVIQGNIKARKEDIGQAEEIIADNVVSFMDWFGIMDIGPLVGKLREKFHQISQKELDSFLTGENNIQPMQKQKIETAVNRVVDKLLHRLINNFHIIAKTYGPEEATHLIDSIIHYQDRSETRSKTE